MQLHSSCTRHRHPSAPDPAHRCQAQPEVRVPFLLREMEGSPACVALGRNRRAPQEGTERQDEARKEVAREKGSGGADRVEREQLGFVRAVHELRMSSQGMLEA